MVRPLSVHFALLAIVVAIASPGRADTARWAGWAGLPVASLTVEGIDGDLAGELRDGLELSGRSRLLRRERARFFPGKLDEDLARARLFLARHGYPFASVGARVTADGSGKEVAIVLAVEGGPAVRVASFDVRGLPDDVRPGPPPLAAGSIFRDALADSAASRLARTLRESGRAQAEVDVRAERTADSTRVAVVLEARPGPRFRVGAVRVEGAPADLQALVRDAIGVQPGDPYAPSKLRAADTSLRELDLFRSIRLDIETVGEATLDVVCTLVPRQPRTLTTGVGYYSEEQLRGEATWLHRNLLGGGRAGRIGGQASRFLQTARTDLTFPRILGTAVRGNTGVALRREDEDAYRLVDVQIDGSLRRPVGAHTTVGAGVTVAYVDVAVRTAEPVLDDPIGVVTSVPLSWSRDTSDHPAYPTRGTLARVDLEATPPGIGSVAEYGLAVARVSRYLRTGGSTVLAGRLLGGIARPFGPSDEVLASRRMYGGGSRSLRGLGRRRLGPKDSTGDPVGGDAKFETSVEWRFPILGRLEGAAFLDGGQVWSEPGDARLRSLVWAAGPALMIRSPVGPLRLDWGILLDGVDGEPPSTWHFSVGNPF